MEFPTIDQKLALRQLALLGHSPNNPVYLRFFYPSDDPRKDGDKGRKSDHLNWKEIETYQSEGRGAYLVVNGGGHKNDDVVQGRAIFIEHDDLEKEIQRELWKILELPEPTFQVDTGGKSIHSYWVFNEAVDIEKWCQLQKDLLEYGDGDRSIKNPARVMRLAGAWHISHDEKGNLVYKQTRIISDSAKTYSFEDLRELIPSTEKERLPLMVSEVEPLIETVATVENNFSQNKSGDRGWGLGDRVKFLPNTPTEGARSVPLTPNPLIKIKHPDQIKVPVNVPIPLLDCCRTEVRDWVNNGVAKGCGRNDTAINVGLELVAVERHLQTIGQSYNDSARQLFSEFCQRSGMTASEDEMRWKWCHEKNPSPSCGDDGISACIRGWYWREVVKPQPRNSQDNQPGGKQGGKQPNRPENKQEQKTPQSSNPTKNQAKTQYEQVPEQLVMEHIDEILDQNLNDAQQDLELNKLAKSYSNFNPSEIRAIANKRIKQRKRDDNLEQRQQELERLEALENREYNPFRALFYDSPATASQFEHLCRVNRKIQPQYFLSILSVISSVIGTKGSLKVPVLGRFRGTIHSSMVGESGEGKSIVSGILLDPLYRLQKERLQEYQKQEQEYEQLLDLWEKQHKDDRGPKPRRENYVTANDGFLVINEYSREGIVKNHADNPNGLLIHQEELVAIQRAQNMYRQGKGDDRQFLNNLYDNKAIARSLKSERIIVEETAVSIMGGYQPEVILGEMGDLSDPDGQWARFNFVCGQEKRVFTDLEQPTIDVSDILYHLYKKALNAPPVECHLDKTGRDLLQDFVNEMEEKRWHCLEPGWRAVLSKASGEVCRIALDLHWMNCLLNDQPVSVTLPGMAIEKAIEMKRFFLSQIELIRTLGHADPNREDSLAPVYSQILKIAKRLEGTTKYLTVRKVQSTRSGVFKNIKADGVVQIFKDLAAMGKAKLVKFKRSLALEIDSLLENQANHRQDSTLKSAERPRAVPRRMGTYQTTDDPTPVLLETVGGLLNLTQPLKTSLEHTFSSIVGFVGTVGGSIFSPLNWSVTSPTQATIPTLPQTLVETEFSFNFTPPQHFQQCSSSTKTSVETVTPYPSPVTRRMLGDLSSQPTQTTNCQQLSVNSNQPTQVSGGLKPNEKNKLVSSSFGATARANRQGGTGEQSLVTDVQWLLNLLKELENHPHNKEEDEWLVLLKEAESQIDNCFEQLNEACPNYLDKLVAAFTKLVDPESSTEAAPPPPILNASTPLGIDTERSRSVNELKALMLACESWVQLKHLHKQHGEQAVKAAYTAMNSDEQIKVDGIAATAIPYEVYKYVGPQQQVQGQVLEPGSLVYIDPTSTKKTRRFVLVWLLQGIERGWQQAISVSRDCLQFVEKVVNDGLDAIEGHQGDLWDLS